MLADQTHHIANIVDSGNFSGADRKPMGRVTVDPYWNLNLFWDSIGGYDPDRLPVRWWVAADNPAWKNETEIPSVKNIKCNWSVDQDAATCDVVIYNTLMVPLSNVGAVGSPGALTSDRGKATNRWGHTTSPWTDVLVPSAILRTYQGYGGYNDDGTMKPIADCIAGGFIVQTGTWVIDNVTISSNGEISLTCRDMMILLLDQYCFPPLVPKTFYPVEYKRFKTVRIDTPVTDYGTHVAGAKLVVGGAAGPVQRDLAGQANTGYWLSGDDGGVFSYGINPFKGANISRPPHSIIGMASVSYAPGQSSGPGYWTAENNGSVYAFGAPNIGNAPRAAAPYVDICSPLNVNGLYMVTSIGEVAHLQTTYYGGTPTTPMPMVSIAARPDGDGYWLMNGWGQVYAYGAAPYAGGSPNNTNNPHVDICGTQTGNGYWILDAAGHVYAFGDAAYYGGGDSLAHTDPFSAMIMSPDGLGYWLIAQDGGVFSFGSAIFYGSMRGGLENGLTLATDAVYTDFSDIVKDFLLWSGFWLHNETDNNNMPAIYGTVENTVTHATDVIPHDLFDKQTIVDCILKIRENVGYLLRTRSDGSVFFGAQNWWGPGNFLFDRSHTSYIPRVDEYYELISYTLQHSRLSERTNIIITTDNALGTSSAGGSGTLTTNYIMPTDGRSRGIIQPTIIYNPLFDTSVQQEIMAQLIALQIVFQRRVGQVTAVANPLLEIDDQIQIFESQSEEMWVHYLRGISTDQDLDSGSYIATYTTHWLGDPTSWVIQIPDGFSAQNALVP